MKSKQLKDLRETKTIEELEKIVIEKSKSFSLLRNELSIGKYKDVRVVKKARLELAQVKSILSEMSAKGGKQ